MTLLWECWVHISICAVGFCHPWNMWQVNLRPFVIKDHLKVQLIFDKYLGLFEQDQGNNCPNLHLLFFFSSPRTKMSSCLYHLRKQWKFLPHSQDTTYGLSKQGRTYWQLETPGHTFLYSWAQCRTPPPQYYDTLDKPEDNKWLSCITPRNKTHNATEDSNTNLNTIQLHVAPTLANTLLSFDPTILVKGKNALSWLVTSSNTKPCNLNTPLSRDNNTGSCVNGGVYHWKTVLKSSHIPADVESYALVQTEVANRILPFSWLILCSQVCSPVF